MFTLRRVLCVGLALFLKMLSTDALNSSASPGNKTTALTWRPQFR
jgi:hypothetical protein